MLEPEAKQKVRSLWQKFYDNGITDTLGTVQQISYLILMRRIEILDVNNKQIVEADNLKFISIFDKKDEQGNDFDDCRWSKWKNLSGEEMLPLVRERVFPFIKKLNDDENSLYSQLMSDATFLIEKASLLKSAVNYIEELDISHHRQDVQGDIFEEILSELQQSGKNGQFRTPRHIIDMMVDIVNPQIGEKICDPACGTGGFLMKAYEHIVKNNTNPKFLEEIGPIGDKISAENWNLLRDETFFGFEVDKTIFRIGVFNMILHGISNPNIVRMDSISKQFDHKPKYQIVLANPPFTGSIDKDSINDNFTLNTKKTELLFLELFYNILENGGRGAIIVPTGVLFGSSKAHVATRKLLLDECQLDAIVYLPSGVFKPYAGVSTAVLFFTKGGKTDNVWLYDVEADGYTLDDKRDPIDENDLPDVIEKFAKKEESKKSKLVPIQDIIDNVYNLSVKLYIDNSEPEEIIDIQKTVNEISDLKKERQDLEKKVSADLKELGFEV